MKTQNLNRRKTESIIVVLVLFVTVISCSPDVTGSADDVIKSVQVTAANIETQCDPGFYSTTGNTPCEAAPVGKYVPEAGAIEAINCPVGTYQNETGQSSCKPAEPGSFVDVEGAASSSLCPVGTFSGFTGAAECAICPEGQTTDGKGATACILIVNDPTTKADCKKGEWENYGFKNQGQCIRFVNTGKDSR